MGYSLFKLMDTACNSHDPLTHLSREKTIKQQGYKKTHKVNPKKEIFGLNAYKSFAGVLRHHSEATVFAMKKIRNFYAKPTQKSSRS